MVVIVLGAFVRAEIADLAADFGQLLREPTAPNQPRCREAAQFGTVAVEPDALGKHRGIRLSGACLGTALAFLGAGNTGIDAGFESLICHDIPPLESRRCQETCAIAAPNHADLTGLP
jgi:hypothetical protein